jgi:hypothetical protein
MENTNSCPQCSEVLLVDSSAYLGMVVYICVNGHRSIFEEAA